MQQEYDETEGQGRSSAISWMVMVVAALGFLALGWFAFHATERRTLDEKIITLEAYDDAYKYEPEDKGGMEFPHQDKTIYDNLDGTKRGNRVEKLFPEPEAPIIPETVLNAKEAPAKSSSFVVKVPASELAEKAADAKEDAVKEAQKIAAPKPVVKPVVKTKTVKQSALEAPVPVAAAPKIVKDSVHALQLGAFTSEEDAKAQWRRIQQKHGAVLAGHDYVIVRADLEKGTFYRLRAVGFASKDAANAACKKLASAKQACYYVKR